MIVLSPDLVLMLYSLTRTRGKLAQLKGQGHEVSIPGRCTIELQKDSNTNFRLGKYVNFTQHDQLWKSTS